MKLLLLLCWLAVASAHMGCRCCNGTHPIVSQDRCAAVGYATPLADHCTLRGCEYDEQCRPTERCTDGLCMQALCTSDAQCDAGMICTNNECINAACTSDNQCPSDTICALGLCVTRQCSVSAECMGLACVGGFCSPCSTTAQCASPLICNAGACINHIGAGNNNCYHVGARCIVSSSSVTVDGTCCSNQVCYRCCSSNDCSGNVLCCNNYCNFQEVPCCSNGDCPSELPICLKASGTGRDRCVQCLSDNDCSGGTVCDQPTGTCLARCGPGNSCPLDFVCEQGLCFPDPDAPTRCTTTEDCPGQLLCLDGICNYIECETNVDCPEDYVCAGGICQSAVFCETDEDCSFDFTCVDGRCEFSP